MPTQSVHVAFPDDLVKVYVHKRRNRFVVEAFTQEKKQLILLHLPNSGRMQELLVPGTIGMAVLDGGGERKTAGTLLLVRYNARWVSVDARMPNRLFAAVVQANILPPFQHYTIEREEVPWGRGRLDFQLQPVKKQLPAYLVETKSCNLVESGLALFPDAPTTRGTRHVNELAQAVEQGYRAAVVWFVQRDDADALAPHDEADPAFGRALRQAIRSGVETYAYRCQVSPHGMTVMNEIQVHTRSYS